MKWFDQLVHRVQNRQLVYACCWEDPAVDRQALRIAGQDNVLVITSAGCNALSYALDAPARIFAVDINPQQNALLELKIAGINALPFEEFFQIFGKGHHADFRRIYRDRLRALLPEYARTYWDRRAGLFAGKQPFYFRGASGSFLWLFNAFINRTPGVRSAVNTMLDAEDTAEQWAIYQKHIQPVLWGGYLSALLRSAPAQWLTMIPASQVNAAARQGASRDLAQIFQQRIEHVIRTLPMRENYFWRVYLTGSYTVDCCPDYLQAGNFERLKNGLCDRISVHCCSVEQFLIRGAQPVDCFALLDHFDWHSTAAAIGLQAEIDAICRHAAPAARLVWRSLGDNRGAVDAAMARNADGRGGLKYHEKLQRQLLAEERTGVYASLYAVDLP